MKRDSKINFLGIGAAKSGTTWLYAQLNDIPEFDLPPVKEIHYFDRDSRYDSPNKLSKSLFSERIIRKLYLSEAYQNIIHNIKKLNWKHTNFYLKWYFSDYNDNWYLSLFDGFNNITGEITPGYAILNEEDVKRMYRLAPNAKIIFMLRNPVKRAWSHFRFFTKNTKKTLAANADEKAILDFINSDRQEMRSNYMQTIQTYCKVFPRDQILIGFYDAIIDCPDLLIKDIIGFISNKSNIQTNHLKLNKVIHKSESLDCPEGVHNYLKEKYYNEIKSLAENYGGYFGRWLEETYGEKSKNENIAFLPTFSLRKKHTNNIDKSKENLSGSEPHFKRENSWVFYKKILSNLKHGYRLYKKRKKSKKQLE